MEKIRIWAILKIGVCPLFLYVPVFGQEGNAFVWTQVRYASGSGGWDPYPSVHADVASYVAQFTSVQVSRSRRVVSLKDHSSLFASPFLVLSGREVPRDLDDEDLANLRAYVTSGGFLWIEDNSGLKSSPFDRWVRRMMESVFPDAKLSPLPPDHVVFKTFFLVRGAAGRVSVSPHLEGLDWAGRTAVLYSHNDLQGAWAVDALGQPLLAAVPGGEPQREMARRLTLNIILYSLTGSYKTDAVHQPFLLEKLRSL